MGTGCVGDMTFLFFGLLSFVNLGVGGIKGIKGKEAFGRRQKRISKGLILIGSLQSS